MIQKTTGSILLILLMLSQLSCTKLDNYNPPNATLNGQIIDVVTGAPIQTNVYDCMIELDELSWSQNPQPFYFTTRQDGTFTNTKVFAGKYKITPVNGPFIPVSGQDVDIKGDTTKVSFLVEPFLNIEITDLKQADSTLTVSYKISSKSDSYKITDSRLFINNTVFVGDGNTMQQFDQDIDFTGTSNQEIYANTYQFNVGNLISGRTYYVRVGARSDDPVSRRYNYSEIKKVVIP